MSADRKSRSPKSTARVASPLLEAFRRKTLHQPPRVVRTAWAALTAASLPLIEPIPGSEESLRVTFVWRPGKRPTSPSLYSPVANLLEGESALLPLPGTGVWYRSFVLPRTTRATYAFSPRPAPKSLEAGSWTEYIRSIGPDPHNPARLTAIKDPDDPEDVAVGVSVIALPGAPAQPWAEIREPTRWKVESERLPSESLQGSRRVWVFMPPDFNPHSVQYNLLVGLDGLAYQSLVPTPKIVEYLVRQGRLGPSIVVLVESGAGARERDLAHNPHFVHFLAGELIPWLRLRYHVSLRALQTVIFGSSLGGLTAALAAYRYPEVFGNVLAQSPSFFWRGPDAHGAPTIMSEFANAARKPIKFYLDAGRRETVVFPGAPMSLLAGVQYMRDVLLAKGYSVGYSEFDGGHDYACWSGTLADGLLYLLGR